MSKTRWEPARPLSRDQEMFWWVVPKSPDETYTDGRGRPILATHAGRLHRGVWQSWSALEKATHMQPTPPLPAPPQEQP